MNTNSRACVADIARAINSGSTSQSIYDYSQGKHISISGSVSNSSINIFDHDRRCHLSGNPDSFYDYGTESHISLKISGNQFRGYAYDQGHHYKGTVSGKSVSIFDYGEAAYFNYQV
ncbi:hypothetical protein F4054_02205 [Candidatus Poribacteria bacterium]|nr:hypothetical protein [Candidatus Poribacteria bacterium]MYG07957.1 hypothetical protein [Candidatus Poribacteria bacterium]MYK21055.1 hypothetical protein [Candidatus Poribacteria bacterium]